MNRLIEFKAKTKDTKEWVFGLLCIGVFGDKLIQRKDKIGETMVVIDPNTLGQFTGCVDRIGLPIFEGERVRFHYIHTYEQRSFPEYVDLTERTIKEAEGTIYWNNEELAWYVMPKEEYKLRSGDTIHTGCMELPLAYAGITKEELYDINSDCDGVDEYTESVLGVSVIDETFEASFNG